MSPERVKYQKPKVQKVPVVRHTRHTHILTRTHSYCLETFGTCLNSCMYKYTLVQTVYYLKFSIFLMLTFWLEAGGNSKFNETCKMKFVEWNEIEEKRRRS